MASTCATILAGLGQDELSVPSLETEVAPNDGGLPPGWKLEREGCFCAIQWARESGDANSLVDFSPDGRFLSYTYEGKRYELWILPLTGDRRPYRFYPSESVQSHGQYSPDGKWIAYTSNETGDFEVYVQPFQATGEKWKVSVNGGGQATWRHDGKEMFYRTGDGEMMAVSLKITPGFVSGVPRMLFQSSADPLFPNLGIPYAAVADGRRFLVNAAMDESRASPIIIITNWTVGLKR